MSADPAVSVIMIFLDEERFIREAIESVLAQSYGRWELLLVDDGSSDASTAIAKNYAALHSGRIRYLEHPGHANLGTGASRNAGLEHARGEYVAFLDADDVWVEDKLAWEVELLDARPEVGLLFGQTLIWYSWDMRNHGIQSDHMKESGIEPGMTIAAPHFLTMLLRDEYLCPACGSIMIRRRLVEQVGGWEEEFRGQYEDMVLYVKLLVRTPVYVDGRVHSLYRQHESNSWVADRAAAPWRPGWLAPSRHRYLEWTARYIAQQRDVPDDLREVLTNALLPYRNTLRFLLSARGLRAARRSIRPMLKQAVRALTSKAT